MVGSNLCIISGIDGSFDEFFKTLEPFLKDAITCKISYNRTLSFLENVKLMRRIVTKIDAPCSLLGWSIGAVAACFLSDCFNVKSIIMINPFFDRADVLSKRNIICDEDVKIRKSLYRAKEYLIIRGEKDDKIPPEESEKIVDCFGLDKSKMFSFPNACHSLASFPTLEIVSIIINQLYSYENNGHCRSKEQ